MSSGDTYSLVGKVGEKILESLARYRFLCIPQFIKAGASTDDKTIRVNLAKLKTAKMVRQKKYNNGPPYGSWDAQYWLTRKGAKWVADGGPLPFFPKNPSLKPATYHHRCLLIDALIMADRWARLTEQGLPEVGTYLQFAGEQRASAIAALKIEADALLRIRGADDDRRTYAVEVCCSDYSDGYSTHSRETLETYVKAAEDDALDEALGVEPAEPAARVLVVCDTPELRDRLLRTLPARQDLPDASAPVWGRFFFKAADELVDFGNGWHQVAGDPSPLPTGCRQSA